MPRAPTRRTLLAGLAAASGSLLLPSCHRRSRVVARGAPPAPPFHWGLGIENTWMVQANPALDGPRRALDEFELTGHYAAWKADLALASQLGVTVLRYGVPWSRAEPKEGVFDWSWIDAPMRHLVEDLHILPIFDLLHYGTPAWLERGIGEERFPEALARYARAVAEHFSGRVTHFTPCNEPRVAIVFSAALGVWPPYQRSRDDMIKLGLRLARAMVLATQALREVQPKAVIVSAESMDWTLADSLFELAKLPEAEREALRVVVGAYPASIAYGKVAPSDVFGKFLAERGAGLGELEWFASQGRVPDIVGYNHYPDITDFAATGDFTRKGALPLAIAAREAATKVELPLRRVHAFFDKPVWVSETSAGLEPVARAAYARALGELAHSLLEEGFPLRGINWWPLFEAVQWNYRDLPDRPLADFIVPGGWNAGLYRLRLRPGTTPERLPTEAVQAYREVVALPLPAPRQASRAKLRR